MRIRDKKLQFLGHKKCRLHQKMVPTRSVLVNWQGCRVQEKFTKKPYLITLNPAFLGPEGLLE